MENYILHSIEDVVVTLNNVAHVPGLRLKLFSLHAVGKQQAVTIDPVGVHVMPGRLVFPRNDVGSQLPATRKVHKHTQQSGRAPVESGVVGIPPVAAATIAPPKMLVRIKSMDVSDMHVSYAHAHPAIVHETARQLGFRLTGDFRACAGCSTSKGKRQPLHKTTLSPSERPLQRVFVDLSRHNHTQSVGGLLYLMLIKDDFSRF